MEQRRVYEQVTSEGFDWAETQEEAGKEVSQEEYEVLLKDETFHKTDLNLRGAEPLISFTITRHR